MTWLLAGALFFLGLTDEVSEYNQQASHAQLNNTRTQSLVG
jgi:hypothetical protein